MASYMFKSRWIGGLMSIISREKKPKGGGQSPQFKMRIDPALKEQLDAVAAEGDGGGGGGYSQQGLTHIDVREVRADRNG